MTVVDVLLAHRWSPGKDDGRGGCIGCAFSGSYVEYAAHVTHALWYADLAVVHMPTVPFKGPNDTDASMLYTAAAKAELAKYPVGGSNVGGAVAQVLREVADQQRRTEPSLT